MKRSTGTISRRTEKGVLFKSDRGPEAWLPLSQIRLSSADGRDVVEMPDWLYTEVRAKLAEAAKDQKAADAIRAKALELRKTTPYGKEFVASKSGGSCAICGNAFKSGDWCCFRYQQPEGGKELIHSLCRDQEQLCLPG